MNETQLPTITRGIPKKAAAAPFLLILLCFLFPFVEVSCQGQKMMSFTGYQAAFGTDIQQPNFGLGESPRSEKVKGTPVLALVLVCALIAAAACFFNNIVAAVFGGIGVVLMFATKAKIDGDTLREGQGILTVSYGSGFYFTLLLLLAGIGLCILIHKQRKRG